MSKKNTLTPLVAALGAAVATSLVGTQVANAKENPFTLTELSSGYMVADNHASEGTCGGKMKATGEGNCGADKKAMGEGKCGEGKCGADKKAMGEGKCGEGKCGADKKAMGEGKCGEGKCGANK